MKRSTLKKQKSRANRWDELKYTIWSLFDISGNVSGEEVQIVDKSKGYILFITLTWFQWERLCKKLRISTMPTYKGYKKVSNYFEKISQDELDMLKIEHALSEL